MQWVSWFRQFVKFWIGDILGKMTMRVLIIDDEAVILEMICKMLAKEGCDVLVNPNGVEGLRLIRDESKIDILITDIIMSEKEGMEIIHEIERDFSHIRILAISGKLKYLPIAKVMGADLTLDKPFSKQELFSAIHQLSKYSLTS